MKKLKIISLYLIVISLILSSCHPNIQAGKNKDTSSKSSSDNLLGIQLHTKPYNHFRGKMENFPSYDDDYNTMDNETFDLREYDLSNLDLNSNLPELLYCIFDSTTVWPEKMPKEFVPIEIMEKGKNPGLQVKKLHKEGFTGKGISIGIIDGPILTEHKEFKDSLVYYNHIGPETSDETLAYKERFHGNAVASLLAGKNVGVAPEVNLYYVAASAGPDKNHPTYEYYAQAIHMLLDLNKHLPDQDKIRAISVSWSLDEEGTPFAKEARNAVQRAIDENVPVFFPDMYSYMPIHYCSGADRNPLEDPDKPSSYSLGTWEKENYDGHKDGILFPMDSRSFASQTGVNDYVWMRHGGWSWVMPYITGLYAICLQINSTLSVAEFSDAIVTTADTIIVDNLGSQVPIILVNPVELIKYFSEK